MQECIINIVLTLFSVPLAGRRHILLHSIYSLIHAHIISNVIRQLFLHPFELSFFFTTSRQCSFGSGIMNGEKYIPSL